MSRYQKRLISMLTDPKKEINKIESGDKIEHQLARKFREILLEHHVGLDRFESLINRYCMDDGLADSKPLTQDQIVFQLIKTEMNLGTFRMALSILGVDRAAIPTDRGTLYLSCQ